MSLDAELQQMVAWTPLTNWQSSAQVSGDQKRRLHRSPYLLNHDIEKLTPIADNALLTLQEATVA